MLTIRLNDDLENRLIALSQKTGRAKRGSRHLPQKSPIGF